MKTFTLDLISHVAVHLKWMIANHPDAMVDFFDRIEDSAIEFSKEIEKEERKCSK